MIGSSALRSFCPTFKLWGVSCVSAVESLLLPAEAEFVSLVAIKGGEGKQMTELTPDELEWLLKVCRP